MRHRIPFNLAVLILFASSAAQFGWAAEPTQLGYERWTVGPANEPFFSSVKFGSLAHTLYGTFTNKLELFSGSGKHSKPKATHRLIDIDRVRGSKHGLKMDVVWIKNVGDFEADSWLLYDLTEDEVQLVAMLPHAFILDIESYPTVDDMRYAIILRDNPHDFAYVVVTDAQTTDNVTLPDGSQATLHEMFDDRENWRPIDIDVRTVGGEYLKWPRIYDPSMSRYNAIFVTNLGQNHKETLLLEGDDSTVIDHGNWGYQLVDFEDNSWKVKHYWPGRPHLMIFVEGGRPFTLSFDLATSNVQASQNGIPYFYDVQDLFDRCVDIETHPIGGKTKDAVFID